MALIDIKFKLLILEITSKKVDDSSQNSYKNSTSQTSLWGKVGGELKSGHIIPVFIDIDLFGFSMKNKKSDIQGKMFSNNLLGNFISAQGSVNQMSISKSTNFQYDNQKANNQLNQNKDNTNINKDNSIISGEKSTLNQFSSSSTLSMSLMFEAQNKFVMLIDGYLNSSLYNEINNSHDIIFHYLSDDIVAFNLHLMGYKLSFSGNNPLVDLTLASFDDQTNNNATPKGKATANKV